MPLFTMLDLKKLDAGIGFDILEENIVLAPELRIIPAETISGTEMSLTVRTDLPTVAFRNANEGVARSKSAFQDKTFQCATLDHQVAVDRQILQKSKDGGARLKVSHMSGAVEAAYRHIGKQFYYGVSNDAKGFPGLIAQFPADTDHEVDVTGATALSSVWFLHIARESVQFLFGNETTFNMDAQWKVETVYDSNTPPRPYQAEVNWLTGAVGVRLANKHAAVRIKNIGTAAGKTLTDTHLYSALEKFTTNYSVQPTHIFATPRSVEQLRSSRTNTGSNEKGVPPALPVDWNGIPIIRTSSISNAETI